jgi:small subunit ribosomal protein S2
MPPAPAISPAAPAAAGGSTLVQDLIEAGIHFGQRAASWNPKMQPYIWGKRNGIHIIDIKETIKGLLLAKKFLTRVVADGKDVCFVGTKRQARSVLEQRVLDVKMHFVVERWLGGTLTNFRTIRSRLKRLDELDSIAERDNFASYSKKMESMLKREQAKIKRNLEGIRHMEKLPGAVVVIDVKKEINALREARKLGIPTVCLIDTDGDPDLADIAIPGNDDSMRSIDVIVRELCLAIVDGKTSRTARTEGDQAAAGGGAGGPGGPGGDAARRSRRAQFRADEPSGAAEPAEASNGTPAVKQA